MYVWMFYDNSDDKPRVYEASNASEYDKVIYNYKEALYTIKNSGYLCPKIWTGCLDWQNLYR